MKELSERAALVLQQIDAVLAQWEQDVTPGPWFDNPYRATIGQYDPTTKPDADKRAVLLLAPAVATTPEDLAFIATSRTLLPASLRCLKTAIEGLLSEGTRYFGAGRNTPHETLTTLCDQWEASR